MTMFEKIKEMDELHLAIFLAGIEQIAFDKFETGMQPVGVYHILSILKSETEV